LEDSISDADVIEFELQEAGIVFTSQRAMEEKEFLLRLEEFTPDLILSGYELPQYNGALALAEAKRRLPEVPFILVTGILDEGEGRIDGILAGGASECVLKQRLDRLAPTNRRALRMTGNGNAASKRES
jgi:CheY-like chemotaxis protein